jgi:protoporphyrinogen oxidase
VADIVIVGAGLTGLSAAYYLEKNNFFDYKIFEKNDRPGGLLQSIHQDGFTFDHTGHFLHISNPLFHSFLHDISSFTELDNTQRKSHIFSHNVTTAYPFQMNLYGLPVDVIVDCITGYFTRHTHIKNPQNFHDWVLKYFGTGLGKHFFFSYNRKLLSYDLKKVHPSWTGRFVPSTSLADIITGAITQKTIDNVGYNSSFYYPKTGGIEFIIKQITQKLKNKIENNHTVESIDTNRKIVYFSNGKSEHYNHLITTMPLNKLLSSFTLTAQKNWNTTAQKLICNSVININIGFNTQLPFSAHWLYFPEKKYPWYRIGFYNNICPSLAPYNKSSIYTEFSYIPEKTKYSIAQQKAYESLPDMFAFLGIKENNVATQRLLHLEHAYVIYDQWREKNLSTLLSTLENINVYSIGRYGGWKYSSMQEAVIDGKMTAENIFKIINKNQTHIYPAIYDANNKQQTINPMISRKQIKKESIIDE